MRSTTDPALLQLRLLETARLSRGCHLSDWPGMLFANTSLLGNAWQRMFSVVDLFAGPGGLNEGFAQVRDNGGDPQFQIRASFEMESNAVGTLRLRSALRELKDGDQLPDSYVSFVTGAESWAQFRTRTEVRDALAAAEQHVHQVELGPDEQARTEALIRKAIGAETDWVLIGGPPCQAYSLAGRSRRKHDETFSEDKKHFLFREYLHIIEVFKPAIFVMENVKGLLSSNHSGQNMFNRIRTDLSCEGQYQVRSLVVPDDDPKPADFVIRSENYGVPQRRHRVILLGIRNDIRPSSVPTLTRWERQNSVRDALGGMPPVNSELSRRKTGLGEWEEIRELGFRMAAETLASAENMASPTSNSNSAEAHRLREWLTTTQLPKPTLHDARAHMDSDLLRYAYLSNLAEFGVKPTVKELPDRLKPEHKNVDNESTPFVDRFKVQSWDGPSGTVTSHISKDGHYYIHPDANQMRSLTVREAARLQTFPDDYFFMGGRTAQYHQVGNAVPPLLAHQIGGVVAEILNR